MKDFFKKNKLVTGGIVAAVAIFLVYHFYSGGEEPLLTTADEVSPISGDLLIMLGNLNTLKLDQSVFNDPVFVSLTDFGVVIPPSATGRRNPFEPIGGIQAPPASPN